MNSQVIQAKTNDLVRIGVVANVFEWYEFCVYAYLASIIGQVFFSAENNVLAVIYAFFAFSLSYLARPLGSLFFGYMGDRRGRGISLRVSITLMAIPTVFIGFLPTYQTIGVFAPILLMLCRFVQGFAAGGELPGSACYLYEAAQRKHRTLLCASVATSSLFGLLLGSGAATLLFLFFDKQVILDWAWRLPFLLGLPLTIVILFIRRSIVESFSQTESFQSGSKNQPILKEILKEKLALYQAFILVAFLEVCIYLLFVWMPSYLEHFLHLPTRMVYISNVSALFILATSLLFFAYLARFVSHKMIMFVSVLCMSLASYPLFMALQNNPTILNVFAIQILFAVLLSGLNGVIMETLGNLFTSKIRCTGMSLSFTCGAAFFGGSAPALCSYLIYKTGNPMIPAFYIILFGLLALSVIVTLKKPEISLP